MLLAFVSTSPAPAETPVFSVLDVLYAYRYVFFVALGASLLLTPLFRRLALANGVVDLPDFQRKQHRRPVAYLGGVAIFLAWMAGILVCYSTVPHNHALIRTQHVSFPVSVLLGATIIAITGLLDDIYKASPRVKVGGQLIAAAMLAGEQVGIKFAQESLRSLGWAQPSHELCYVLGTLVIALLVVGGCNAMNLIDGLDGLAAGSAAIATLGFLCLALFVALSPHTASTTDLRFDAVRPVMCLAMLGAILGFLPYNFNPARIFMGDAGSLLLGYLCVSTILLFADTTERVPLFGMAGLIIFGLPIIDTLLAIFRRKLRGGSISSPDKLHLHHQLLRRGLSVRQAVLVLYAAGLALAVLGSAMVLFRMRHVLATFVLLYGLVLLVAYRLGKKQAQQALEPAPSAPTPESAPGPAPGPAPEPLVTTKSEP